MRANSFSVESRNEGMPSVCFNHEFDISFCFVTNVNTCITDITTRISCETKKKLKKQRSKQITIIYSFLEKNLCGHNEHAHYKRIHVNMRILFDQKVNTRTQWYVHQSESVRKWFVQERHTKTVSVHCVHAVHLHITFSAFLFFISSVLKPWEWWLDVYFWLHCFYSYRCRFCWRKNQVTVFHTIK